MRTIVLAVLVVIICSSVVSLLPHFIQVEKAEHAFYTYEYYDEAWNLKQDTVSIDDVDLCAIIKIVSNMQFRFNADVLIRHSGYSENRNISFVDKNGKHLSTVYLFYGSGDIVSLKGGLLVDRLNSENMNVFYAILEKNQRYEKVVVGG